MIDKKNEKVYGGYDYRKRYNRILFWLILFSFLACLQAGLIMSKVMSTRFQNYYISTTAGLVKPVASVKE